jgi:hypothetical protein
MRLCLKSCHFENIRCLQVQAFMGDETLEATLYSVVAHDSIHEFMDEDGFGTTHFEARARFVRHPHARPGVLEVCIQAVRSTPEQMGPVWRCRTRKALDGLLTTSLWRPTMDYVLVLRRGPSANRWANDRRQVDVDTNLYSGEEHDAFVTDEHPGRAWDADTRLGNLGVALRLALEAFPPQEGYICFHVGQNVDKTQWPAWRRAMIADCMDLVEIYVGELEPAARA